MYSCIQGIVHSSNGHVSSFEEINSWLIRKCVDICEFLNVSAEWSKIFGLGSHPDW